MTQKSTGDVSWYGFDYIHWLVDFLCKRERRCRQLTRNAKVKEDVGN